MEKKLSQDPGDLSKSKQFHSILHTNSGDSLGTLHLWQTPEIVR